MNRRATTDEAKRAIVERLLSAWLANPHLRLGQLIQVAMCPNGIPCSAADALAALHYIEDEALAEAVEGFGK